MDEQVQTPKEQEVIVEAPVEETVVEPVTETPTEEAKMESVETPSEPEITVAENLDACADCAGSGLASETQVCPTCAGTGKASVAVADYPEGTIVITGGKTFRVASGKLVEVA